MAVGSGTNATPSRNGGGRAFRPGPRWAFGAAALAAVIVAAVVVFALKPGGGHGAPGQKYGTLPSWLPKMHTVENETPELATVSKPVLAEEQGYTVSAKLPGGSAQVTANGPVLPGYVSNYVQSGKWPSTRLVPVSFYVTFASVKGDIALAPRDFNVLDGSGTILQTKVSIKGGGKLPAVLHSGQTVTLDVRGKAIEGQGSIRWAPGGKNVLVGWIYQLELD